MGAEQAVCHFFFFTFFSNFFVVDQAGYVLMCAYYIELIVSQSNTNVIPVTLIEILFRVI